MICHLPENTFKTVILPVLKFGIEGRRGPESGSLLKEFRFPLKKIAGMTE
jgi:hypothetical protein